MRKRPSVARAVAAAGAILSAEGVHEQTVAAAEFLVDHAWDVPRGDWHGAVGAKALATHAPPGSRRWLWKCCRAGTTVSRRADLDG